MADSLPLTQAIELGTLIEQRILDTNAEKQQA
jgi:hypothetical protein